MSGISARRPMATKIPGDTREHFVDFRYGIVVEQRDVVLDLVSCGNAFHGYLTSGGEIPFLKSMSREEEGNARILL
jgi:hypothetical protein